jgi:elongation factor 3
MSFQFDTSTAAGAARATDRRKRSSMTELKKVKRVHIGQKEADEAKELLGKLLASEDVEERKDLAQQCAAFAHQYGVRSLKAAHIWPAVSTEIFAKKIRLPQVLGAFELAQSLITSNALLRGQLEPHLITLLHPLLDLQADKQKAIVPLAAELARSIVKAVNPIATRYVCNYCIDGLENSKKWQTKMLSLELIELTATVNPMQLLPCLPILIPVVSDCMWDTKADVKKAATKCMATITELLDNKDIERFIPAVIECINQPEKVPETIHQLGATTFVQEVDSGTLALMVPLLSRGLKERQTPIKRKSALIIDNMCKLVDDPDVAAPFLPVLLPGLEHVHEIVADPECRGVVEKAIATLQRCKGDPETTTVLSSEEKREKVYNTLDNLMTTKLEGFFAPVRKYMAKLALALVISHDFDKKVWAAALSPHAATWLLVTGRETEDGGEEADASAEKLALAALASCEEAISPKHVEEDEQDEGEELCNCEFSLAYGAKILLNRTHLRLMRGRRYGLCGANGCGKSTLMRAIANEQVEGFPPRSVLKTVYVEHDIDGSEADTGLVDFIASSEGVECSDKDEIARILKNYGFTDEMVNHQAIGSLSGGWKMKLALARAMLMNADILLLDEPTNHLDVVNVAWLENYLLGLKTVTSIIVSHDSGFLDHVCTDIIHYEGNFYFYFLYSSEIILLIIIVNR